MFGENNICLGEVFLDPFSNPLLLAFDEVGGREDAVDNDGVYALFANDVTLLFDLGLHDISKNISVDLKSTVNKAAIPTDNRGEIVWPIDARIAFARERST